MSRWVTFYYNSIDGCIEDFKVHSDKENALKYFNQNCKRYFEVNTNFKTDKLPCSYGFTFHRYYGISAQSFKKQLGISVDEALIANAVVETDKGETDGNK